MEKFDNQNIKRRDFCKIAGEVSAVAVFAPVLSGSILAQTKPSKPKTNIEDALKFERNENSMPGKFPAKVIQITNEKASEEAMINYEIVYTMLEKGLCNLANESSVEKVWKLFVSQDDIIGIKVNPVAGKILSTSLELTKAVIAQLEKAGINRKKIVIWDRREFQLTECGFTNEAFPDIEIIGTERQDKSGSFVDDKGILYSEQMIDKSIFYWADIEGKYDKDTLPYMVNEGFHSYFTKICTQKVTKIINIPILKNAGGSLTGAMKNLAYGSITNTGRLHQDLWAETCAEVCAFPPLRDKVVLNIIDGIRGCINGGPGANPQFIRNINTLLVGTDPVAIDRIAYEIILKKRLEEKIIKEESAKGKAFLELAQNLKLGTADLNKINWNRVSL
ncbi:MAG: DUF362 domain-containing protein [Bacteroidota bacterium]